MTANHVRILCLAPLILAVSFVLGCGPSGPVNDKVTLKNIKKVKPGMKLTEIEAILGPAVAASAPASYDAAKDGKLEFKKWEHSPKGHNIVVGFDSTNEAALVDNTK
ncbi:MAG: hypothetical protein ACR2FY_05160 [Pirellulaceae bacterium]